MRAMTGKKTRGTTAKKRRQAREFKYRLALLAVVFFVSLVLFAAKAGLLKPNAAARLIEKTPVPEVEAPAPAPAARVPAQSLSPAEKPAPEQGPPAVSPPSNGSRPVERQEKPQNAIAVTPEKPSSGTPVSVASGRSEPVPEKPVPPKRKGTLVFVFDDAGHNLRQLEPFLRLPFPVTIAVLPGLEYSRSAAERARAAGKEVILHQPMQAVNLSYDPGPGAIRQGMNGDEIRAIVRKNLDEVGPVKGLNNHEGSLITSDPVAMGAVLDVARERGIYFLDSRTIANTAAPAVAKERNMYIWERAVFLDNIQERESIIDAVGSGLKIAERKGAAIMIGHIWSSDLAEILADMYPELVSQGFSLSTIANIAVHDEENR